MSQHAILAIDQGTTNTKALLFDKRGAVVSRASVPVDVHFPAPGWVEQDPALLWQTVTRAIDDCLAGAPHAAITSVAVSNQRESAIVWDRTTGRPLGPCIVWQCRRTAPFCADLRQRGLARTIEAKTGLTIDPLFSASKFRWLLDHVNDGHARAAGGDICLGNVDSWLLWNLTAGAVHACDVTNASRTELFNLASVSWDQDLLDLFEIPLAALPAVKPSSGVFGVTAAHGRLSAGVPIAALIGDSHAALFGHAAFDAGVVKATYGTGSSLMTRINAPIASRARLSTTIAWGLADRTAYALEGNITTTGGAVDWTAHLFDDAPSAERVASLADRVADSNGVYLVPAFAGLGAPYWDDEARGLLAGLTRGSSRAHVARAAIESIGYQVRDVFDAMQQDVAEPLTFLFADGGPSRNRTLMQFQADILGCPVIRRQSADLSAQGAAWLAGLATGVWTSTDALAALPSAVDRFQPAMADSERARRYDGWTDAVHRARRSSRPTHHPVVL